jgi:hypothetical protein
MQISSRLRLLVIALWSGAEMDLLDQLQARVVCGDGATGTLLLGLE